MKKAFLFFILALLAASCVSLREKELKEYRKVQYEHSYKKYKIDQMSFWEKLKGESKDPRIKQAERDLILSKEKGKEGKEEEKIENKVQKLKSKLK